MRIDIGLQIFAIVAGLALGVNGGKDEITNPINIFTSFIIVIALVGYILYKPKVSTNTTTTTPSDRVFKTSLAFFVASWFIGLVLGYILTLGY